MLDVPTLRTERLVLRGHRMSDCEDSFSLWTDSSVTRFIGGRPFSEEEVWIRLLRNAGSWAQLGFGFWAVFAADSGAFVGEVGFADYRRDLQPSIHGTPEIGWALLPAAQDAERKELQRQRVLEAHGGHGRGNQLFNIAGVERSGIQVAAQQA